MALVACKRKTAPGERGQALLELLPVVSVLLLLTFGVIESSYAIWQLEVITALTREGSNLASRGVSLPCPKLPCSPPSLINTLDASAAAVIADGTVGTSMNLANNGEVIVTAVQNLGGTLKVIGQTSSGSLTASSRIGNKVGGSATIPVTATPLPPNGTIYVTEVFAKYSAITPLGAFVKITMPSVLYDVAYF